MSLSFFVIRKIPRRTRGNCCSLLFFGKVCENLALILLGMSGRIHSEAFLAWTFLCVNILKQRFPPPPLQAHSGFSFLESVWAPTSSSERLPLPTLSSVLADSCPQCPLHSFDFREVGSDASSLILEFGNVSFLSCSGQTRGGERRGGGGDAPWASWGQGLGEPGPSPLLLKTRPLPKVPSRSAPGPHAQKMPRQGRGAPRLSPGPAAAGPCTSELLRSTARHRPRVHAQVHAHGRKTASKR